MDGCHAAALEPGSPCLTPNFDQLRERGLQFRRCYTPAPTCSPARASLMTGLLPHNHGVLEVEHGRDPDQVNLRRDKPHWAQQLLANGYDTGYFGKWHIERSNRLEEFGWKTHVVKSAEHHKNLGKGQDGGALPVDPDLSGYLEGPRGYNRILHWGVTDTPPEDRYPALTTQQTLDFIENAEGPWCACASFSEPNEALVVSRSTFERYDPDTIPLPATLRDDFSGRPNFYARQQQIANGLSDEHWRMARTCYFGRITELDDQFGWLLHRIDLENTVVVVTADHGRYVGAHGFDAHNFGGFEDIFRVPMIAAGPGIATGETSAVVGLHDLCPTLLDITGSNSIQTPDSKSFARLLHDPAAAGFDSAFAENHGTRFRLSQRILWQGDWKFVFNGFDFDELYNLADDPDESKNLAADPAQQDRVESMMGEIWRRIRETGDRTLAETHYFSMRIGAVGPNSG